MTMLRVNTLSGFDRRLLSLAAREYHAILLTHSSLSALGL